MGPTAKRFINTPSALQGELLFSSYATLVQAFYQYHLPIKDVSGLKFYFGGGPGVSFVQGNTSIFVRPMTGLEYKMKAPLALHLDWRPILLWDDEVRFFEPVRFGLGLKYSF